eukprot:CAMPEP_0206462148 /NCGR_PEP_ID=MMETSP0324_2-20121206/25807_1 /ASSEMBLY_ACC=CAM_ASM_000836 /TAXON_ID=2866 /ORGANISM="Crypthecodinium cohnii, Strain Seligo" /LENGTH=550 /DNA_ID=CAMNT_0053934251 /DNA_START=52 /DNA_END=1704 /DNA_ORIENTATION=+
MAYRLASQTKGAVRLAARRVLQTREVNTSAKCLSSQGVSIDTMSAPTFRKMPVSFEKDSNPYKDLPELVLGGSPTKSEGNTEICNTSMNTPIKVEEGSSSGSTCSSFSKMPDLQFGELENGVRIVVIDRKGMCSSVGVFLHAGSRYEPRETSFMPHVFEHLAFRSSKHLSHMRTMKTMEQLGAGAMCRVGREDMLYYFDCLREYVPVMLHLALANVLCPLVTDEEVADVARLAPELRMLLDENIEGSMTEMLHATAYKDNTLGHSIYMQEEDFPKVTPENVRAWKDKVMRPDNLIVVGVNTDFDELCQWVARSCGEFGFTRPKEELPPLPPMEKAIYTGGDMRVSKPNPLCHLMLGWEVKDGWNGSHLAPLTVLQMFLGGGGSFSTGGPGKGMHTRLYTSVLNKHHWVESCQASSVMYADSGLFTVYSTIAPDHAGEFLKLLARIFKGLNNISSEELQRAKNALKSSVHMNLEMRNVMMEDIGRQLILSGKVGNTAEFGAMIDAVTVQDVQNVLRECLKSAPTVIAYGGVQSVPAYDAIKNLFQTAAPPV